jgi:phenylpyruvate tautomerase PptA (4-oxalocrotonate tautomerase family)
MRDKKARLGQGAAGRLTLVKNTEIVRSITAIHHEKTGAPRYLIQVIFYAVAPDSHYVIGQPAPANQIWILIGQGD